MSDDYTAKDLIREQWSTPLAEFHAKEAAKYRAKAAELEARGKHKAAERQLKVAARNERLAAKHAAK